MRKDGSLLYDYPGKGLDCDTVLRVGVAGETEWVKQELVSPRVPIVRTFQRNGSVEITQEAFAVAPPIAPSGQAAVLRPTRHDLVLLRLRNTGDRPARITPVLHIRTPYELRAEPRARSARIQPATQLLFPEAISSIDRNGNQAEVLFRPRTVAVKSEATLAFGIVRGASGPPDAVLDLRKAAKLRARAERYWKNLDLPYGKLNVPDQGVQALLDSSIRNIYQAREIKDGLPAFQVGPTCYRGLWVVDGSFLMESVTFLGRADEARNGIKYLLGFQRPDGAFMLIDGHYKETGIVLWAVARHALLTGDKAWLESVWPQVERGFEYIRKMRAMPPKDAPNAGLIPAGYSDGGLSGKVPEYTNVYWMLAGVRAAINAALWLGHPQQAADWQKEYDDFMETFRRAAARDMRQDSHGNRYLPIRMQFQEPVSPQKAQWAFLHAIFPGKIFAPDDPLVTGNMAMLQAAQCEGLVRDTGWIKDGLWNYFGSFYAHAWLWLGRGDKAASALYSFGNHASPLLAWREEQMPRGHGEMVVGDMPHNWASAEFIRLVRHSLILERGNELHLLEAMPREWARPGALTSAKDIATEFGPVSLECRISKDGRTARVKVTPPTRNAARKIWLHLDGWTGKSGAVEVSPSQASVLRVELR